MNQIYLDSARLLTRVAPLVLVDDTFALKGGTAINLFLRNMPRLSVDLDLVFPDHALPRDQALRRINEAIRQSAARLRKQGFQIHAPIAADSGETKLLVRRGAVEVKIEVNFVMRGTVFPMRMASLAIGDILGHFIDANGGIADPDLDARTLGLRPEQLRDKERAVAVSAGRAKRRMVLTCLRAGYINVLVTDEATALYCLERRNER